MRDWPQMPRLLVFAFFLLSVAIVSPGTVQAQGDDPLIQIEDIRIGLGEDFTNQSYKVGTWTPVRVRLQAGPERFQGLLRLEVKDDGGIPTYTQRRIEVPARTTQSFLIYGRPGDINAEFLVSVYRENRSRPVDRALEYAGDFVDPSRLVIATMGHPDPKGLERLTSSLEYQIAQPVNAGLGQSLLQIEELGGGTALPDQWYGYDAAEVVVLDTNDFEAMDQLQDFRSLPLIEWVRNGGHLVLAIGQAWQTVVSDDSVLRPLLPALPIGRTDVTSDPGALEAFAGSTSAIPTQGAGTFQVTNFELVPGRSAQALLSDTSLNGIVVARGAFGLGRVTVVGLDVDQRPFVSWEDSPGFWKAVLEINSVQNLSSTGNQPPVYYRYAIRDLSSYLNLSLEQFDGVRLVPFGWVALFVFLYILLIGPGDYFFLKKVLKRMELTWITFPSIVIIVSLIAYVSAYTIKGTELRLNRVDVVDIDQGTPAGPEGNFFARGTSFTTLFSPQNRDYDVATLPLPLDSPDPASEEPIDPAMIDEMTMTWFGKAESGFGSMGGRSGIALTGRGYTYVSLNDERSSRPPEQLMNVRVPIWTTKALMGTWYHSAPEAVAADLKPDVGVDRLSGTLTNQLERPLTNVVLIYGEEVYFFDRAIAPGETVRIEGANNRTLNGYLEDLYLSIENIQYYGAQPQALGSRTDMVRALSFARSAGSREEARQNLVLSDLDLTGQRLLGRPILLADLAGPSSTLLLNNARPETAVSNEGTVLRVLLPRPTDE